MNGCGNPHCKCAANLPSLNGHFRHLMRLVNQSLDKARTAPTRRMKNIHVVHMAENETTSVALSSDHGCYLHRSVSIEETAATGQVATKTYYGPCGFLQVFGTRADFDASSVGFGDPASVLCTYDDGGPDDQFLFIVCVPLRLCAGCHRSPQASFKCSRCRAADVHARYCSRECQVKHWPVHRAVCGGLVRDEKRS